MRLSHRLLNITESCNPVKHWLRLKNVLKLTIGRAKVNPFRVTYYLNTKMGTVLLRVDSDFLTLSKIVHLQ